MNKHECQRCGYRWLPRIEARPVQCPGCKSPYWDRPKVRSSGGGDAAPRSRSVVAGTSPDSKIGGYGGYFGVDLDADEDQPDKPGCGYEEFNGEDGRTYRCGLPPHSPKVKHGNWVKVD